MVENLCQGAREDATDFMIRVGSSISNLRKDWKGQITEAELRSSNRSLLNGVREEIRHVLDSEIARHGQLTPHQLYKVVKKYETYVAHKVPQREKCQPSQWSAEAVAQTSGYRLTSTKPRPSRPPSMRPQTLLCLSRNPLFLKTKTI